MEGELNNLIEQNNVIDKKFEINEEEEDDFQSSFLLYKGNSFDFSSKK